MPKFAGYDSTQTVAPVTGWYDTDDWPQTVLPPAANLLAMTDAQWADRMTGFWAVQGGALVAYTPPAAPSYVPASLIRTRLQTAGKWDAAVAAMTPGQMAWFCTLELGVLPSDRTALALLTGIGADPTVILAPPSAGGT